MSKKIKVTLIITAVYCHLSCAFNISQEPVLIQKVNTYTKTNPLFIGGRTRIASLSSASWFHKRCLATVHLVDERIYTYLFDEYTNQLHPLQEISNKDGALLVKPESISIAPNGTVCAVANARGTVNIYSIDATTHHIKPSPMCGLTPENVHALHGTKFSSTGNFLAVTAISPAPGYVMIYKINEPLKNKHDLTTTCALRKNYTSLIPKSISFSPDDSYIAVAYASCASCKEGTIKSLVAVHRFDSINGIIESEPCSTTQNGICCPDDITFAPDGRHIIIPNQGDDTATIYEFDDVTGQLSNNYTIIKNPEAQLSFPHGIDISDDSKYMAVANYGTGQLNIYAIEN